MNKALLRSTGRRNANSTLVLTVDIYMQITQNLTINLNLPDRKGGKVV